MSRFFSQYFKDKKCKTYFAPFNVRFPRRPHDQASEIFTVLQPDLSVICDLVKLDDQGCLGAPDMIVEILSTGNSKKEMNLKYEIYQEAGVKEYWIMQPEYDAVVVYLNEHEKFIGKAPISAPDKLHPFTFPDLEIDLQELFAI